MEQQGTTEKQNRTGYPSIDKPWLQYYSEKAYRSEIPTCSMYDYVYHNNVTNLSHTALEYFGKKISYKEFFYHVDRLSRSFYFHGIRKSDVVTIMSMQTPETIYSIYALNRIGAIANVIYMTLTEQDIVSYIEKTNSVLFLYLDRVASKIEAIKDKLSIPTLELPLALSMPLLKSKISQLKAKSRSNGKEFLNYIKEADRLLTLPDIEVSADDSAVIVYTSGTTGMPKGVVHTNLSINSVPFQYKNADMSLNSGDTYLNSIPPFLGFGISVGMHTQLSLGMHGILNILPEAKVVAKTFMKKKPMHMIIGPVFVAAIIEQCKGDMSWLVTLAGGGGSVSEEQELTLNRKLKECKSNKFYTSGYGMTEFGATVCTNMNRCNKSRSMGIPFAQTNIKVINSDTCEELTYNETGELCFSTPNMMKGYFGENNEKTFFYADGQKWFKTGDLGHIDEDGFVYFDGRLKRIHIAKSEEGITYKVFPIRVEELLSKQPNVEYCGTIAVDDEEGYSVLISFIQPKDGAVCSAEELMNICVDNLPTYSIPKQVIFVDEMPTTQSGKIDYAKLETLLNDFVII